MTAKILILGAGPVGYEIAQRIQAIGCEVVSASSTRQRTETVDIEAITMIVTAPVGELKPQRNDRPYLKRKKGRA